VIKDTVSPIARRKSKLNRRINLFLGGSNVDSHRCINDCQTAAEGDHLLCDNDRCNKYAHCDDYMGLYIKECPEGQLFEDETKTCVDGVTVARYCVPGRFCICQILDKQKYFFNVFHETIYVCVVGQCITKEDCNSRIGFDVFGHHCCDPSKYVECSDMDISVKDCPAGQLWDDYTKQCADTSSTWLAPAASCRK